MPLKENITQNTPHPFNNLKLLHFFNTESVFDGSLEM